MAIKASQVKELREKTGAGMMDCKKALTATDGDMQAAIDWLREKGISKAAKKASRIAAEGAVGAYVSEDGKVGVLVEINCETDFAAGNEQFRALVEKVAKHIAATNPADLAALNASEIDGKTVEALVTEATATIGEKISLRRFTRFESAGKLASYIHMGGKIGVLVNLTGGSDELGKDVAMQVAAANPISITRKSASTSRSSSRIPRRRSPTSSAARRSRSSSVTSSAKASRRSRKISQLRSRLRCSNSSYSR